MRKSDVMAGPRLGRLCHDGEFRGGCCQFASSMRRGESDVPNTWRK